MKFVIKKAGMKDFFKAIENICNSKKIEKPHIMEFHYEDSDKIEVLVSDKFLDQLEIKELKVLKSIN